MNFVRNSIVILAVLLLSPASILAIDIVNNEKGKLEFVGFLKLDMTVHNKGVNSFYAPRFAQPGSGDTNMTAMHSRFGFKWTGAQLESGFKVGGYAEWDLFDASANQMKFRTRQAYLSLAKGNSTILLGQTWDVFSPLGPTTLMTNGYLWQTGNLGFRRAQVRYNGESKYVDFAFSVGDPASEAGIRSQLPLFQSRVGVRLGPSNNVRIGVSGVYSREEHKAESYQTDVDVKGLSLDWSVPFARHFEFKGELANGDNLATFLSRGGVFNDINLLRFQARNTTSSWSELLIGRGRVNGWIGYAFENLTIKRQLTGADIKDTHAILGGIQYKLSKEVSLGMEYTHFQSRRPGSSTLNTSQVIASGTYSF